MSSLGHQLFCQPEQLTFWIAASISEEMRRGRTLVLHLWHYYQSGQRTPESHCTIPEGMRRGRTLMLSSTVAIPRWAYTFHLWYKYYKLLFIFNKVKRKCPRWDITFFVNQASITLDRFVPPTRGAPWSYAEHHSQYYYRSDITSPPLTLLPTRSATS